MNALDNKALLQKVRSLRVHRMVRELIGDSVKQILTNKSEHIPKTPSDEDIVELSVIQQRLIQMGFASSAKVLSCEVNEVLLSLDEVHEMFDENVAHDRLTLNLRRKVEKPIKRQILPEQVSVNPIPPDDENKIREKRSSLKDRLQTLVKTDIDETEKAKAEKEQAVSSEMSESSMSESEESSSVTDSSELEQEDGANWTRKLWGTPSPKLLSTDSMLAAQPTKSRQGAGPLPMPSSFAGSLPPVPPLQSRAKPSLADITSLDFEAATLEQDSSDSASRSGSDQVFSSGSEPVLPESVRSEDRAVIEIRPESVEEMDELSFDMAENCSESGESISF